MSTVPPRKRPGAPETKPPIDDFDEAPTSVAPSKERIDMPREFDPGGADEDEPVTSVAKEPSPPAKAPVIRPEDDDDTAPTKDM